ncbi:hypothetical protein HDU91_000503, partial [Kappamyces sp. JEL0680]
MSEATEYIYFAAALYGIGVHEIANCAYFQYERRTDARMARIMDSRAKQLRQPIFIASLLTLGGIVGSEASVAAMIHWRASSTGEAP